jgi:hypothetical protein
MSRHAVVPQRPDVADHAAPDDDRPGPDPAAVAQYASTLLPGVLWVLGSYAFDGGAVPGPLQGTIGLLVTGLCTVVDGCARRVNRSSGD